MRKLTGRAKALWPGSATAEVVGLDEAEQRAHDLRKRLLRQLKERRHRRLVSGRSQDSAAASVGTDC